MTNENDRIENAFVSEITRVLDKFGIIDPDFVDRARILPSIKQVETLTNINREINKLGLSIFIGKSGFDPMAFDARPIHQRVELVYSHVADLKNKLDQICKFDEPTILEDLEVNLAQKLQYVKCDNSDIIKAASLNYSPGYYIFASGANIGKTNTLVGVTSKSLSLEDFSVLYLSIDDSAQDIAYRLMSCLMDDVNPNLPVKVQCWAMKYLQLDHNREAVRRTAHELLAKYIKAGRLEIYDSKTCRNFDTIEKLVTDKKKQTDKKIIVIIDGVLLLDVPGSIKNEFEKNEIRANELKRIAVRHNIPLLTSHELVKMKDVKSYDLNSLKGSGRFGYNANFVCLLTSDEKDKNLVHCEIVKNKICAIKKKFMMRINPDQSTFYYV